MCVQRMYLIMCCQQELYTRDLIKVERRTHTERLQRKPHISQGSDNLAAVLCGILAASVRS